MVAMNLVAKLVELPTWPRCNNIIDDEGAYHLASVIGRSGLARKFLRGWPETVDLGP